MNMRREDAKSRMKDLSDAMDVLDRAKKPMQEEWNGLYRGLADATARRCNALSGGHVDGGRFAPDELTFAAYNRCPCGAGLAYPNDIGAGGFWDCSAILMGVADLATKHAGQLPFAFYEIKSEGQPSACGATTRPSELQ